MRKTQFVAKLLQPNTCSRKKQPRIFTQNYTYFSVPSPPEFSEMFFISAILSKEMFSSNLLNQVYHQDVKNNVPAKKQPER